MTGRLAVDFGTSNTVLSIWDETRREGIPLHIPELSKYYPQGDGVISAVPSLIHYTLDNRRWIGEQVFSKNMEGSEHTFRWMKRYISHRSPLKIRVGEKMISPFDAGRDFLSALLVFAIQQTGSTDEEVVFTVPVESYEHYDNWLVTTAEQAGITRYRLIDEPSAAALGYGANIQPGQAFMMFDFGGGTMHAAVVLVEEENQNQGGRRCRVLGKAGRDIGGTSIDQWLFQKTIAACGKQDFDEDVRRVSNMLLIECERAKEKLSTSTRADISAVDPASGAVIDLEINQSQFEEMLDQQGLFTEINRTIRQALNSAAERGYSEDHVQSVLMIGGSSQIPSVQKVVRQFFGKERVKVDRPLEAVARGAAAFAAGVDFYDHIQHDYALRYTNKTSGVYEFRTLVNRGTPYPTEQPVARLSIRAAYSGQRQLGIQIYELGQELRQDTPGVELVFDQSGAARVIPITPDLQEQRSRFWMNENNPTFLTADPPAKEGEPRFEVEFRVDANKRLAITSRDLFSGQLTHKDYPVVRLT